MREGEGVVKKEAEEVAKEEAEKLGREGGEHLLEEEAERLLDEGAEVASEAEFAKLAGNDRASIEARLRANMKRANTVPMTRATKGMLAEARTALAMEKLGFTELPARLASNHGFDGVWVKYAADGQVSQIVITESKFSKSGRLVLGQTKTKGKQMSEEWVRKTIREMLRSGDKSVEDTAELLLKNEKLIKLKAAVLQPNGRLRFRDLGRYKP